MIRRGLVHVTVALLTLSALGVGAVVALRAWRPSRPFKQRTVERSQPALLRSLTDLAELHAAKGQYQVLVDVEHDTAYVPSLLKGDRVVYAAQGSVDALVDLSALGPGDVRVEGQTVHVTLPPVVLGQAALDLDQSHVVTRQRGLLDRLGSAVGSDTDPDHALLSLAEGKVGAAAASDAQLRARAEANVRTTITSLLHGLGEQDVVVDFRATPAA